LKEISHKGLAELVGTFGSLQMKPIIINILISASVEPDQIDRKRFSENFSYGIIWLINHTIKAKDLAIKYLRKAHNAFMMNNESWIRYLGIAFHFIADWGTPHHSPTSVSNPVLKITKAGVKLGGIIGYRSGSSKKLFDKIKRILKGIIIVGGIAGGIGIIILYLSHKYFEIRCDERWEENLRLIKEYFIAKREEMQLPTQLELAFDHFEEKMNILHKNSEILPVNWIDSCNNREYAEYMSNIAIIMELACQIVTMNN